MWPSRSATVQPGQVGTAASGPAARAALARAAESERRAASQESGAINMFLASAAGHVGELGQVLDEGEAHLGRRPVAVLGHDDLGRPLLVRLRVVGLVPVDEADHVSILLY